MGLGLDERSGLLLGPLQRTHRLQRRRVSQHVCIVRIAPTPDDLPGVLSSIQAHLQERLPYDVEYRLKNKEGEYGWFRARGQAIWGDDDRPYRMAGSITDISKRKKAEASLRHERFLFQTLFQHLPDAIFFKDANGRFTRVTTAFAKWLGVKHQDEVIGKTDHDFFPPDAAAEALADERRLMDTGQLLIGKEEYLRLKDDKGCWVSTTKVPLRDETGLVIGTFGISHDISFQKLAQERFRLVIEAAPNAMIVVGGTGEIQMVNAATEQMFGYSRTELIGSPVEILVPKALPPISCAAARRLSATAVRSSHGSRQRADRLPKGRG